MGKAWARGDYCTLAPDKLFSVYLGHLCLEHDILYDEYTLTRKNADLFFKELIEHEYILYGKPIIGKVVSKVYYTFVRMFGFILWKS